MEHSSQGIRVSKGKPEPGEPTHQDSGVHCMAVHSEGGQCAKCAKCGCWVRPENMGNVCLGKRKITGAMGTA